MSENNARALIYYSGDGINGAGILRRFRPDLRKIITDYGECRKAVILLPPPFGILPAGGYFPRPALIETVLDVLNGCGIEDITVILGFGNGEIDNPIYLPYIESGIFACFEGKPIKILYCGNAGSFSTYGRDDNPFVYPEIAEKSDIFIVMGVPVYYAFTNTYLSVADTLMGIIPSHMLSGRVTPDTPDPYDIAHGRFDSEKMAEIIDKIGPEQFTARLSDRFKEVYAVRKPDLCITDFGNIIRGICPGSGSGHFTRGGKNCITITDNLILSEYVCSFLTGRKPYINSVTDGLIGLEGGENGIEAEIIIIKETDSSDNDAEKGNGRHNSAEYIVSDIKINIPENGGDSEEKLGELLPLLTDDTDHSLFNIKYYNPDTLKCINGKGCGACINSAAVFLNGLNTIMIRDSEWIEKLTVITGPRVSISNNGEEDYRSGDGAEKEDYNNTETKELPATIDLTVMSNSGPPGSVPPQLAELLTEKFVPPDPPDKYIVVFGNCAVMSTLYDKSRIREIRKHVRSEEEFNRTLSLYRATMRDKLLLWEDKKKIMIENIGRKYPEGPIREKKIAKINAKDAKIKKKFEQKIKKFEKKEYKKWEKEKATGRKVIKRIYNPEVIDIPGCPPDPETALYILGKVIGREWLPLTAMYSAFCEQSPVKKRRLKKIYGIYRKFTSVLRKTVLKYAGKLPTGPELKTDPAGDSE